VRLSIALRREEIDAGQSAIDQAMDRAGGHEARLRGNSRAIGFFAHATATKTIERTWWLAFWESFLELQPDVIPVEFLPSPRSPPTDARFPSLHLPSPRDLTAAIAATRMFVSADTGPMHLASSTAVPTAALFRASDPTLYGPLKSDDLVIDVNQCTPQVAAQRCHRMWHESIRSPAR
jgi:heptosyltransferase-3